METINQLVNQKEQQLISKTKEILEYIKNKEGRVCFALNEDKLKEILTEDEYELYSHDFIIEDIYQEDYEEYTITAEVHHTLDIINTNESSIEQVIEGFHLPISYTQSMLEDYRKVFTKVKQYLDKEITQDIVIQGKVINELLKLNQ